ncbi:MAG: hypothetical protein H0V43_13625 [Gemmatimonadales bacterium]|nr:hypothetical protein [Gemmatimonadales bacterium]
MHRLRFALLLLLPPMPALGQASSPRANPCGAPEHRQFDFWIGQWEVQLPDGSKAGTNRIEPILGGCALRESWSGMAGGTGHSYNVYDRSRKLWHQTWVDSRGNLLQLEGGFVGGRMTLQGKSRHSTGAPVLNRIVWWMTAPGRVRQLWETSQDGGTTWTVAFDGRYIKR